MITIPDVLKPEHVLLDLAAKTPAEAIKAVTAVIRRDPRVLDWETASELLAEEPTCCVTNRAKVGLCLCHARTDGVSSPVMSAIRLAHDLAFAKCGAPVRYLFCLAVPQAMAADYLRIVGALMRIVNDPATEELLHHADQRPEFVEVMGEFEMKL